jgi:hypothetical protein
MVAPFSDGDVPIVSLPTRLQTSYEGIRGEEPTYGKFFGFDHIHWW